MLARVGAMWSKSTQAAIVIGTSLWILASGVWDDSGEWDDSETWNDGA